MALTMLDTSLIYIGDRESDIVAMKRCARDMGHPAGWLAGSLALGISWRALSICGRLMTQW